MPFSILLLTAATSKRHISGYGGDKVSMESNPGSGELALFFQLDEETGLVRRGLNMAGEKKKCCDGLVFYAHDSEIKKIICLVEMKSNDLADAEEQIRATRDHLKQMLHAECKFCPDHLAQVTWAVYIYRRGSSPKQTDDCRLKLEKTYGFGEGTVAILGNSDIGPFLRKIAGTVETRRAKKSKRPSR